jgi:Prokaryotic membrane lipoprotein lipid attachment site
MRKSVAAIALAFVLAGCQSNKTVSSYTPKPLPTPTGPRNYVTCPVGSMCGRLVYGDAPTPAAKSDYGTGGYENPAPGNDGTPDCAPGQGPVYVGSSDPYGLDRDGDGWGCE